MNYYAGIDVSLEWSSVCVVDGAGGIVCEARIASTPAGLLLWFGSLGISVERIGLEAGPLSQWLVRECAQGGLSVELLETRHVARALSTMPVKSDRSDARGIAQLMRVGWFRPVHCKSLAAQEMRALLKGRDQLRAKLHDLEMHLRGQLRNFGLKVGHTTRRSFSTRISELVAGHPVLEAVAGALLSARDGLLLSFTALDRQVRAASQADDRARLLMTVPGVGSIVGLTYLSGVDDPGRFASSRLVGAHFGLTPTKRQSGESEMTGRISKVGDADVRAALYEAAHVILTRPIKGGWLKSWAMKLARRAGMRKAKVALARRLAVIMHRMWVDGTAFNHAGPVRPAMAAA